MLIQRGNLPKQGMWALLGDYIDRDDVPLEASAQREAYEETGIEIPLHPLRQVSTYEDFEDPRGYVSLRTLCAHRSACSRNRDSGWR